MRSGPLLFAALLGACCAGRGGASHTQGPPPDASTPHEGTTTVTQDDELPPDEIHPPKIAIEAAPRYLLGFPIVVAVTYDNRSSPAEYYLLPDLDLFFSRGTLGVSLAPATGGPAIEMKAKRPDEDDRGATLPAGEMRRMVVDLSNFGLPLSPGSYRLTLAIREGKQTSTSNPVALELVSPSAGDAKEAARLRMLGAPPTDTGAWAPFLKNNWSTVVVSPSLSFEAQRQLALHLFLHRVFYGPEGVAQADDNLLARVVEPSLGAETGALRYEIAVARNAPDAGRIRSDLLARFPGLAHRLSPEGALLARGRAWYGAEKKHLQPPSFQPYSK